MPSVLCLVLVCLFASEVAACVGLGPNSRVEDPEECDDGNTINGDGCNNNCLMEKGYTCSVTEVGRSTCFVVCGDGLRMGTEACDDGNTDPDDGCTECEVDEGYVCFDNLMFPPYPRSTCVESCPVCGDGQFLISPCTRNVAVRCVACQVCTDRQVETSPCTNDHDRVCSCLPGTVLGADGQCLRLQELPRTCDWQAWGAWGDCGLCGGVRTRSRLAGPAATSECPQTYLESEVCAKDCAGLSFEQEKEIILKYREGTAGYGSLSLYAFWSGEGAALILGKYGLRIQLSQDPEGDALDGRFYLKFLSSDSNTTCNAPSKAVDDAYEEVKDLTIKFLVERRGLARTDIDTDLDGCEVAVKMDDNSDKSWLVGAILGPIVFVLLLASIGSFYYIKNRPLNLKSLPPSVRWQYEQFQENPGSWKKLGTGTGSFYHKKLDFDGEEFDKLGKIFYGYQGASEDLPISEAYAVYNPMLISAFIAQYQILRERFHKHPELFKSSQWMLSESSEDKVKVNDFYTARSQALEWNEDNDGVVILPALHGTDLTVARSICSTGFASLSLLDGGWYGRGIYFSTYAMYCTPYFANRRDPALIISYVISGNAYPVCEDHLSQTSLLGSAITSGYTSHFAVVKEDGRVPSSSELSGKKCALYDEVVIPQESQIMPVWVLRLDMSKQGELGFTRFKRSKSNSKSMKSKMMKKSKKATVQNSNSSNDLV